jgi:hypothetical protein
LRLPAGEALQTASRALAEALRSDDRAAVKDAGEELLAFLSSFYRVATPGLSVLGSRPRKVVEGHYSYELFGDYTPATRKIRVWMRTAVLGKVTSHRGLLNTLLHEFCHHLDMESLGYPSSPHTRGFFVRVDALYHLTLATPPEQRRALAWLKQGNVWRIDWRKMRPAGAARAQLSPRAAPSARPTRDASMEAMRPPSPTAGIRPA